MNTMHLHTGQSLTEVIIAIALITLGFAAVGTMVLDAERSTSAGLLHTRAAFLAEEGIEASRALRDGGFSLLAAGVHGLTFSSGQVQFSGDSDAEDQFVRTVEVTDLDPSTKRVVSTVTWASAVSGEGHIAVTADLYDR